MKVKILIYLLLTFISFNKVFSQSFFHFKFKGHIPKDTITYYSFFVKFTDGTGFMRVAYTAPDTKEAMIIELKMQEQYFIERTGMPNKSFLYYKPVSAEIIKGKSNLKYIPGNFWYKINTSTKEPEPWAVSNVAAKTIPLKNNLLAADLLKSAELEKEFVLNYFSENEDFVKTLFTTQTKNITPAERDITLHLICVANTNEKIIGGSCLNDMNRVILAFNDVVEFLGIESDVITISGNNYSLKRVEDELKKLRPDPNDIVIFYYSGHGFRKETDKRPYPYLDLRAKTDTARKEYLIKSKNIEDIYDIIKGKGARLNLVIGDCCNSLVTATNAEGEPISETKDAGLDWSEDNCRALFLTTRQSIIATAAKEGQLAASNNNFGGFFSYFFKTAMENHFSQLKKNVSWKQILDQASIKTIEKAKFTYCAKPYIRRNICNQIPITDIK